MHTLVPDGSHRSSPVPVFAITLLLSWLVTVPGASGEPGPSFRGNGNEETYTIDSVMVWDNTTIFARSIEVTETGTLIIAHSDIILNKTSTGGGFVNRGRLYMNDSVLIPPEFGGSDHYVFESHGPCEMNRNEIVEPRGLVFHTTSLVLRENAIFTSGGDAVVITGNNEADSVFVIHDNTVLDSGGNAFRFQGVNAELNENRIFDTRGAAFHLTRSKITARSTVIEDVAGPYISIGDDSQMTVRPGTNVTAERIEFRDRTSVVFIASEEGLTTIHPPESTSRSPWFPGSGHPLLLAGSALAAMVIIFILVRRWRAGKRTGSPKFHLPSIVAGTAVAHGVDDGDGDETTVEQRKAGVQEEFGDMALEAGDHRSALEYFDRALALDEHRDEIMVKKGLALERMGRHPEALECYEGALSLNPGNPDALQGTERYQALIMSRTQPGFRAPGYEALTRQDEGPCTTGRERPGSSRSTGPAIPTGADPFPGGTNPPGPDEDELFEIEPGRTQARINGLAILKRKFITSGDREKAAPGHENPGENAATHPESGTGGPGDQAYGIQGGGASGNLKGTGTWTGTGIPSGDTPPFPLPDGRMAGDTDPSGEDDLFTAPVDTRSSVPSGIPVPSVPSGIPALSDPSGIPAPSVPSGIPAPSVPSGIPAPSDPSGIPAPSDKPAHGATRHPDTLAGDDDLFADMEESEPMGVTYHGDTSGVKGSVAEDAEKQAPEPTGNGYGEAGTSTVGRDGHGLTAESRKDREATVREGVNREPAGSEQKEWERTAGEGGENPGLVRMPSEEGGTMAEEGRGPDHTGGEEGIPTRVMADPGSVPSRPFPPGTPVDNGVRDPFTDLYDRLLKDRGVSDRWRTGPGDTPTPRFRGPPAGSGSDHVADTGSGQTGSLSPTHTGSEPVPIAENHGKTPMEEDPRPPGTGSVPVSRSRPVTGSNINRELDDWMNWKTTKKDIP